jgi:dTDP-glucose pyrophosphorylase
LHDDTVFQKNRRLRPSGCGELEITDVKTSCLEEDDLTYEIPDTGAFEPLLRANKLVAQTGASKTSKEGPTVCAVGREVAR